MAQKVRCHGMCKIVKQYDAQQWIYAKTYFPSNLNDDGKFVHEMGTRATNTE